MDKRSKKYRTRVRRVWRGITLELKLEDKSKYGEGKFQTLWWVHWTKKSEGGEIFKIKAT